MTEDELHAYVDGELPAERRGAVEAWLATHPEDAARGRRTGARRPNVIRARYGAVADETGPPSASTLDRMARRRRNRWLAVAAAAALWHLSSAGRPAGWRAASNARRRRISSCFTADALEAYRLYVVEVRHPVEVPGDQRPHLVRMAVEAARLAAAARRTRHRSD